MITKILPLILLYVISIGMCISHLAANAYANETVTIAPQPWQARRAEFIKVVAGVKAGDPQARKTFDQLLTGFEHNPVGRTPMENMDYLAVFYVPKDGMDAALPIIVQNAAMGWYDALRYGSESGRSEIIHNEHFFLKAFAMSGPQNQQKYKQFLKEHPEQVAKLVEQGLQFAERSKDTAAYDHTWPTAYGLERFTCTMGGACKPIPPLPQEKWDAAWQEAVRRVSGYYKAP